MKTKTKEPSSKNDCCSEYLKEPLNKLPVELVRDMVRLYGDRQDRVDSFYEEEDARAIWFDLKTLKKFICHVESLTKSKSDVKIEDLGLRIYYARYPKNENWDVKYNKVLSYFNSDSDTKKYGMKHTLIMVPTIKGVNGNLDFNPEDENTFNGGFQGLESPLEYNRPIAALAYTPEEKYWKDFSVSAQNHGGLFPPKKMNGLAFIN